MKNETPTKKTIVITTDFDKKDEVKFENLSIIIPECCREGWANCPHSVKRDKKAKGNIGL